MNSLILKFTNYMNPNRKLLYKFTLNELKFYSQSRIHHVIKDRLHQVHEEGSTWPEGEWHWSEGKKSPLSSEYSYILEPGPWRSDCGTWCHWWEAVPSRGHTCRVPTVSRGGQGRDFRRERQVGSSQQVRKRSLIQREGPAAAGPWAGLGPSRPG